MNAKVQEKVRALIEELNNLGSRSNVEIMEGEVLPFDPEGEWPPATETIKYLLDDKIIFPGKVAEEMEVYGSWFTEGAKVKIIIVEDKDD